MAGGRGGDPSDSDWLLRPVDRHFFAGFPADTSLIRRSLVLAHIAHPLGLDPTLLPRVPPQDKP